MTPTDWAIVGALLAPVLVTAEAYWGKHVETGVPFDKVFLVTMLGAMAGAVMEVQGTLQGLIATVNPAATWWEALVAGLAYGGITVTFLNKIYKFGTRKERQAAKLEALARRLSAERMAARARGEQQ